MRTRATLALLFLAAVLGSLPYMTAPSQASQQTLSAPPYSSSNTAGAAVYNVGLFVGLAAVATAFIYFVMRHKKFFNVFIAAVWFLVITGVFWAFAVEYYSCGLLPATIAEALLYAPLVAAPVAIYSIFKWKWDAIVAVFSALAGAMAVWMLPHVTVLALLIALPVYDLVMVYWGLLGKIIRKAKEELPPGPRGAPPKEPPLLGLMAKVGDISVGSGDFFAYAMALTYLGVKYSPLGPLASLGAMASGLMLIYAGFRLTVELLLKRYGYAPALPIPLALVMPLLLL